MDIRPYGQHDREGCLAIFDSNTPPYFDPKERSGFEKFLDAPNCTYFVLENDGRILGCGGYAVDARQALATLVWGMIHAGSHKLGLGRFLLLYRLREIGKTNLVQQVALETSQHSAAFFEKQGFKVLGVTADGIAPGLDRVSMTKRLTVCT